MAIQWPGAPAPSTRAPAAHASRRSLSRILAPLLVASLFVTRWRFQLAGRHFLPEHVIVLALIGALLAEGKAKTLRAIATDRTLLVLAAFIGWGAFVTLFQAPKVGESFGIVGWLAFDWLILVALVACFADAADLERLGVIFATVLGALAVTIGIASSLGITHLGTQAGFFGEARPVYAVSYEANILASTMAVWAFIALSSPHPRVRSIARFCVPLAVGAIAFSLTRAVFIGFALGILAWGLAGGRQAARTVGKVAAVTLVAGLLALVVVPGVVAPVKDRMSHVFDVQSGTGESRTETAKHALSDLAGPQAVVGLGTNTYGQRHEEPTLPGHEGYLQILPLQILYDGGVIGAGILVLALATVKPFSRPGRARAIGVLVIYATAATATSPFWLGSSWMLIALAVITRPGGGPAVLADDVERAT